jgi:transposase
VHRRALRHAIETDDWPVVCASLAKDIAYAERRQEKMAQKATAGALINVANTAADAEGGNGQAAKMRDGENGDESSDDAAQDGSHANESSAEQRRGHGRNGAGAFANATHIVHALFVGIIGSICQACGIGRMSRYRQKLIVVIKGQPLFDAQTHHFEQARCKLCGAIVRADGTEAITQSGLGSSYITYDFSACAMLLVMHYFAGVPFKRLESLQAGWGIPMPDANQWSLADASADLLFPLYKALERHGVQNALALRIDDTGSMVIEVRSEIRKEVAALEALGESSKHVRTGINATGVYLDTEQGKVLLFFTGRHHAGEIIDQILQHRQARQSKLVKVSDAASKNFCHGYKDELQEAVCNAHAYLKFRAVKNEHPEAYSLCGEVYKKVFANDDVAKADGMSPEQRMLYHRKHSLPEMKRLEAMCREKLASKLVEPNAPLWEPITFIINQWDRLTTFCHVPGVPLDSNVVEQMLIIPVRYLAASFNYKTQNGADVGDRHMSLIATANANGVEPVAYLTECLENHEDLAKRPEHYLPWVYRERCEKGDRSIKDDRPSATVEHPLRPGTTRAPPANATRPPFTSAAGPRPRFDKTYKHYATFRQSCGNAQVDGSPPQSKI